MSVVATAPYTTATGNGVATSFPFAFACRNVADVAVYVNGIVQNAGITVTLGSDFNSGTVAFTTAPANAAAIIIASQPSLAQQIQFENAGAYNPLTVDGVADAAAIRSIYLAGLLARSPLAPLGETMGAIPAKASRIGKFFGFDASGNPLALSGTGNDSALRTDIAASAGAALVGANDGAGGTIFTSVSGFIAKLLSSTGSAVLGFILTRTGAVSRTVQSKLSDYVHVKDFGAVGDGVTDDTTPLTNFINSAIANPGVPHRMDGKVYAISAVLPTISVDGVTIEGVRGDYHDDPPALTGTVIKWIGTLNAGKMLTVTPVVGAAGQYLTGIVMRGVGFDSNSLIATAVRIESARNCEFMLHGMNSTSVLFDLGITSGTLGEGLDLQNNIFRIFGRQVEAPGGICLQLGGTSAANVSFNDFWCDLQHANAVAANFINSDNNLWHRLRCFRSASGTATESIHLLGGASALASSRDERFLHFSANLPPKIYGTDTYTVASIGHRFHDYDISNSTPAPVFGTGAWVDSEMPISYVPTVTGAAGTGLTTGTISGNYIRNNNFCDVDIAIQVTAGTGYTSLSFTLPFTTAATIGQSATVVEAASTNKTFSGYIAASSNTLTVHSVDGTTALPTGTYIASIRYRVR